MPSQVLGILTLCMQESPTGQLFQYVRASVDVKAKKDILHYQSPLIITELFQHNLINVSYLTACYLYQVMMTLHFLNDVANDAESKQT